MACDTWRQPSQTAEERIAEIQAAIAKVAGLIASGAVKVVVGKNGAVALPGWAKDDRKGISDACALRLLTQSSFAYRQALAKAELAAGRKHDPRMVAAGVHSHDGGKTWHPGH